MTQQVTANEKSEYENVGKAALRGDAPDKLTGRTRFAGDLTMANLLHARLVLSPYAHAKIVNIDISEALNVPGVVAVYTSQTLGMAKQDRSSRTGSPLAIDEVIWSGHPVAIVLAESEAAAEDGQALVDVDYDVLPAIVDPVAAMELSSPLSRQDAGAEGGEIAGGGAHASVSAEKIEEEEENLSKNVSDKFHLKRGNVESGFAEAEVVVERTYHTHSVHQSYLEPQSITVSPGPAGQQLVAWPSTQGMMSTRSIISEGLDMSPRNVRVESVPIGGAFGGKFGLIEPLAAAAARTAGRPVRLVFTRSDDMLAGNPAPETVISLKLGAKRDGTLVGMQGRVVFNTGAYTGAGASLGGLLLSSTYNCANVDIRCYELLTNVVGVGAYRAPGAPQAAFALESTVEDLCQGLEMDPAEFRLKNAVKEGDFSLLDQRTHKWPALGLVECIEKAQAHPIWQNRHQLQDLPAELEGWKVGVGMAVGGWPGGIEPAAAACRLEPDGSLTVVVGTVDLTGSDTTMSLIAAEGLGVSHSQVGVAHDSTDTMPYAGGTGGSKTVYTMGPAVLAAARDAREQILSIASEMLEVAAGDLELQGDKIAVRGAPSKTVTLRDIARVSMSFGGQYAPVYGHGRAAINVSSPMFTAHVAKVAVDPETGEVKVLEYVAAQDVGFAINPAEVEGQIHGGVTQGLGWALFEQLVYDESGQPLTSNFMDYALPHSFDIPEITPLLVQIPSRIGPFGAKGVGEPPVIPVGAAVANAIKAAVGARVAELPITPERLFEAIQKQA
ncbi:MAG TPA: xanthine dehydrogenase family protein molybdopterin-binding subunit [Ktedonobacteraceae bacterium]|nr:xanthine dehydrogenase family protein molybdopterin-binding subunit [Ktedonobacteraceae bacterium]